MLAAHELRIPRHLPLDDLLLRDMESALVWLPEWGYGFLNVQDAPYDSAYFDKYQGYAATEMGEALTAARVQLVERHLSRAHTLIDVGIGCGQFLAAARDAGFALARGFDINPAGVRWLNERGLFADPYAAPACALTFWDSLEHIPDIAALLEHAQLVFCSLPIVPGDGPPRVQWKHYRPDEHCWYFTRSGFLRWMERRGLRCVDESDIETALGREDIGTFAFARFRP